MSTTSLRIYYRPLRIGFLVREGNVEDLIKAVELNTVLFGGIYNPIIPVGSSSKLTDYLIRLFKCDVLHPIIDDEALTSTFSMYPWLSWPNNYRGSELFIESREQPTLGVLDVIPIIKYYWDQDLRYPHSESNAVFPLWEPEDPLNKLFTLQFGKYPNDMANDYSSIYIERMRAEKISIGPDPVPERLTHSITPLALTGSELEVFYDKWLFDGVYVGDPDCFQDLLNFWNLRAAGIDIIFLPLNSQEARLDNYSKLMLSNFWDRIQSGPEHARRIEVYYTAGLYNNEVLHRRVEEVLPKEITLIFASVTINLWNGYNVRPVLYGSEPQTVLANVDELQNGKPQITFVLPTKPLPKVVFYECERQLMVTAIRILTEFAYEGNTLYPPYIPELNEWYGRQCYVTDPLSIRVQYDGIDVINKYNKETLNLIPINNKDLVIRVLEFAGIKATPSEAGIIADRLMYQMGGLEGCRVFKIRGVRKLINEPHARKGINRNRAEEIIMDRNEKGISSFDCHKQLYTLALHENGSRLSSDE